MDLNKRMWLPVWNCLGSSISRTSYVKIENGYRNIKISDLVALKNIFGVDYAEFFKDIPTSRPSKQKQN